MSLLAVDVGAGTQDILLYQEDVPMEGSTKMVLPSQTILVGNRISRARWRERMSSCVGRPWGEEPLPWQSDGTLPQA